MLLIHISDIHFKKAEVEVALDPNFSLRNEILRDARGMCEKLNEKPKAVLISGDIAYAGHEDEYAFAKEWLNKLTASTGCKLSDVFLCPGNHDVDRAKASQPLVKLLHNDIKAASPTAVDALITGYLIGEDTAAQLYSPLTAYNNFAVQFFCDLTAPNHTFAKKDVTFQDGSILRLWGLNSAFVSGPEDIQNDIFVDSSYHQITNQSGVINLTMCHHPFNWLRQGVALRDHLNAVSQIQLFGHEHTNRVSLERDRVLLAAGAMHPDRGEPGWEPTYNLIEINLSQPNETKKLHFKIHVRVWQPSSGTFAPRLDKGREYYEWEINLEHWANDATKGEASPSSEKTVHSTSVSEEDSNNDEGDLMSTMREISVQYFTLSYSEKVAIAGKLKLLEDSDINTPDYLRFRKVLERARDRKQLNELEKEILGTKGNKI